MNSDSGLNLLRFWWAPLLLVLGLELVPMQLLVHSGNLWALWIPSGVLLACQIGLLIWVWPLFPSNSPFKFLLVAGMVMEVLQHLGWRYLVHPSFHPGMGLRDGWRWVGLFASPLVELILLSCAFWIARRHAKEASFGVATAAAMSVMRGGWLMVGLTPLLATLWKDPLPFELCGGQEGQERAARAASLVGLLSLVGTCFVLLPLGIWSSTVSMLGAGGLGLGAMLIGSAVWAVLGARWGRSGKVARILTWVGLGFLAALAVLILWLVRTIHW